MNIKTLDFSKIPEFDFPGCLWLFRPWGSKLHRCNKVPTNIPDDVRRDITKMLNHLCVRRRAGVWYMKLGDIDDRAEFVKLCDSMGVVAWPVQLDADEVMYN